jgi:hypothetical protein
MLDDGEMTSSEPHTAEIPAETSETGTRADTHEPCGACAHPWHAHDTIGVRYCSATVVSSLSRGCICE